LGFFQDFYNQEEDKKSIENKHLSNEKYEKSLN